MKAANPKAKSKASCPVQKSSNATAQKPQAKQKAKTKKQITKKDQKPKTRAQKQDSDKLKKTQKGEEIKAKSQVKKAKVGKRELQMTAKDVYSRAYHSTRSILIGFPFRCCFF